MVSQIYCARKPDHSNFVTTYASALASIHEFQPSIPSPPTPTTHTPLVYKISAGVQLPPQEQANSNRRLPPL